MVPAQWRGYARAWARSVLRSSSSKAYRRAPGTESPRRPRDQASQPFTAYHDPPTNTALLSPVEVLTGELRSVTPGSLEAGDCEEPIRAGPRAAAGAPTPVR